MKRLFALAVALATIAGCSAEDRGISRDLQGQFQASASAPVDVAAVGPTDWERFCVLAPYTTNERARTILGFDWNAVGKTSIGTNDGVTVLVFVKANEVIAYAEHPRRHGDFSQMDPHCLSRAQARVVRRVGRSGWVYLVPSLTRAPSIPRVARSIDAGMS